MEYTIQNEHLALTVTTLGAEKLKLTSKSKIEYLRTKDQYWNRVAPLLFPIVGKLKDSKTYINNKEYHMSQHGFLRNQEFVVKMIEKDMIVLGSSSNKETLKMFPFEYEVLVTYYLRDKSVDTVFSVKNISNINMPFNYGGHPGFKCPLYPGETFEDYRIVFEQTENFEAPTVMTDSGTLNYIDTVRYNQLKELNLNWNYFKVDAIVIPNVLSKSVKLINKQNKGIEFSYPNFTTLAIWTKPNAPFVCLEPWIGHADKHNTNYQFLEKDDIISLSPQQKFEVTYTITIIE